MLASHARTWVETAIQTITMSIVFAHISERAVPVFGAGGSQKEQLVKGAFQAGKGITTEVPWVTAAHRVGCRRVQKVVVRVCTRALPQHAITNTLQ